MEHQKILNLLNEGNDFKCLKRKWNIVSNQSNANYNAGNEIIYNTKVLKSSLCDYNDAYILVRGDIVTITQNIPVQVAFKTCAHLTKHITKIDGTTIHDAEDLHLVMSMCNLIEYSSNYSETTRSLLFYFIDKATNFNADIADNNNSKPLEYKIKLLGNNEDWWSEWNSPKCNNCFTIKIFK